MTAPNPIAVKKCIADALANAGVSASEIDAVNGHLTATSKDSLEIRNWSEALGRSGVDFPYINSIKSMTGHCISAAGSIELVASTLQVYRNFIFPNSNCEDLHPEIGEIVDASRIPQQCIATTINTLAKASFGFGDVNGCVILKKYNHG